MHKTVTIHLDEDTYRTLAMVARAEQKSMPDFMLDATMSYLDSSRFVSDDEMAEITANPSLIQDLKNALEDIEQGKYRTVE